MLSCGGAGHPRSCHMAVKTVRLKMCELPPVPTCQIQKCFSNRKSASVEWVKNSDTAELGVSLNMVISGAAEEMRCFWSNLIYFQSLWLLFIEHWLFFLFCVMWRVGERGWRKREGEGREEWERKKRSLHWLVLRVFCTSWGQDKNSLFSDHKIAPAVNYIVSP